MADTFNILDTPSNSGSGGLLKTGQTTDYTPTGRTTKDDGGFQRGITGSKLDAQYEILTTGQYSGTTAITVNGKTDTHSNECVIDEITGLMWSRTVGAAVFGTGTEDLFWDDTGGSNEDIFEYCDQANLANLSGFNDWRIPNSVEILSLNLTENPRGDPNITAFPVWPAGTMWSSTTRPDNTGYGLRGSFSNAQLASSLKTTVRNKIILCRLGINQS